MIERHMPDVNVVRVDRGGVGTKHRKCFFHGRDQIIKDITLNYSSFKGKLFKKNNVIIKYSVVHKLKLL